MLSLGSSPHRLSPPEAAFSWTGRAEGLPEQSAAKNVNEGWALQAVINWAHFEGP